MFLFHREVRITYVSFSFVFLMEGIQRHISVSFIEFFLCLKGDNGTFEQQIDTFLALPNILPKSITKVYFLFVINYVFSRYFFKYIASMMERPLES